MFIRDYYDIVILPPSSVNDYCIQLSREIDKKYGSILILGEKENRSHISLFHTAITKENIKVLKERLAIIIRDFKPFDVTISKLLIYPKHRALALNSLTGNNFTSLHKKIIKDTDDLINRKFDYHKAWKSERLPEKMKKYIDTHTTPFIGEYFVPHITLSIFKDKIKLTEIVKTLKIEKQKLKATKISVCKLGEHHTCQDIVFEVPLLG